VEHQIIENGTMDPRHKLYKEFDKLTVDPDTVMSDDLNTGPSSSGVTMEDLKKKLMEGLGATHVEIEDLSGTFDAFGSWYPLREEVRSRQRLI
jgi:hypothetical protein